MIMPARSRAAAMTSRGPGTLRPSASPPLRLSSAASTSRMVWFTARPITRIIPTAASRPNGVLVIQKVAATPAIDIGQAQEHHSGGPDRVEHHRDREQHQRPAPRANTSQSQLAALVLLPVELLVVHLVARRHADRLHEGVVGPLGQLGRPAEVVAHDPDVLLVFAADGAQALALAERWPRSPHPDRRRRSVGHLGVAAAPPASAPARRWP